MARSWSKLGSKYKTLIILGLVGLVVISGFAIAIGMGVLKLSAGVDDPPIQSPTLKENEFSILVLNSEERSIELVNATLKVYRMDTTDLTSDEQDARYNVVSYWTLDETISSGEIYQTSSEFIYRVFIEQTGFCNETYVPINGYVNTVALMKSAGDFAITAFSALNGNVTVNETVQKEWIVRTVTLNGTESSALSIRTSKEGFKPWYDFENNVKYYFTIAICFNTTANSDWVEYDGDLHVIESQSSTYVYYKFDVDSFCDEDSFAFTFSNSIGDTFVPVNVGCGIYSTSYSALDVQA